MNFKEMTMGELRSIMNDRKYCLEDRLQAEWEIRRRTPVKKPCCNRAEEKRSFVNENSGKRFGEYSASEYFDMVF